MTIRLLQLHEHPLIIAGAQSATGKALVWLVGMLLLAWHDVNVLMWAAFTLVLLFPQRRRWLLMLVTFGLIVGKFMPKQLLDLGALPEALEAIGTGRWIQFLFSTAVTMVSILVLIYAAIRFDRLPATVRRHPIMILNIVVLCALALGSLPRMQVFVLAPFILWRASYLFRAAAAGRTANTTLKDHLFYMAPVFGGSNTPYGKGPDYLGRYEAKDPPSFARSQLAGIKLLGVATVWTGALALLDAFAFDRTDTFFGTLLSGWSLQLPFMADLLRAENNPSIVIGWISVYLELIRAVLRLAIWGHVIIGCLRLLGFNVFRNTYKPLFAQSIVEFWNRFYFYFKELLVEFFFYPAFYRSGWAGPRLRLLLAIFAAAFVGNIYFHMLREYELLYAGDLAGFLAFWTPRAVYCALLVLGIWLSMLRQQARRRHSPRIDGLSKLRAIAGVWTFYGLIHIWLVAPYEVDVARRCDFLMSLMGL